jgi:hypothetical protein
MDISTTERDGLGLDASSLRRLHIDVLGASERALTRGLDALGLKADAPRPAGVGVPAPARTAAAPWNLDASRALMEAIAPSLDAASRAADGGDAAIADAAVTAWLKPQ